MTIKEIADLTKKTGKTVREWVKKAQAQNVFTQAQNVLTKGHDTDFTLEETIAIIRAGGNNTLADLLLDNARKRPVQIESRDDGNVFDIMQAMLDKMRNQDARITKLEQTQMLLIEDKQTQKLLPLEKSYTVKEYLIMRNIKIDKSMQIIIGRKASEITRMKTGGEPEKINEDGFDVGMYRYDILEEAFIKVFRTY